MAIGKGKVETPDEPTKAKGWLWDLLAEAKTEAKVMDVAAIAARLGYSAEGQLMTAIAERLKTTPEEAHKRGMKHRDPRPQEK